MVRGTKWIDSKMVELLTVKRVDPGSSASDVRLLIGQGIHTHSLARTGLRLTLTVLKDILERRIALARSFVAVLTDGIVDAVPRGQQMEHMVSINALRYVLAEGSNVEGKGYPALDGRWLPPFIYHAM